VGDKLALLVAQVEHAFSGTVAKIPTKHYAVTLQLSMVSVSV